MSADEMAELAGRIKTAGAEIERARLRAKELLAGRIAVDRKGVRFVIANVEASQGGSRSYNFWVSGPRVNKDGKKSPRLGINTPVSLLEKIEPAVNQQQGDASK